MTITARRADPGPRTDPRSPADPGPRADLGPRAAPARSVGRRLASAGLVMALGLLMACTGSDPGIVVREPWIRYSGPTVPAGGFMTITNGGDVDVSLVGVSSPDFEAIELHETTRMDASPAGAHGSPAASMPAGGMVGMRPVEAIAVSAGGSTALEPGGYHLMLFDPTGEVELGARVPLTLTFADGATVEIEAEVRAP